MYVISQSLLCCLVFILNNIDNTLSHHVQDSNVTRSNGQRIKLDAGLVQGKLESVLDTNVESYLGIPYAEPPLGNLRFRKPRLFNSNYSDGVYNATYFRSACSQKLGDEPLENLGGVDFSEDCLHLNIWVPHHKSVHSNSLRPVLFYIYGSAYRKNSPANPLIRGEFLSTTGNIIVVTPNYRLGFLGFACCGENFLNENNDNLPGNLGLHDLIAALIWTRNNIRHFGGDPDAITISGGSAGAQLTMMLVQSSKVPASWISNVFVMSGVPANEVAIDSIDTALAKARFITQQVSCSKITNNSDYSRMLLTDEEIECLRSANLTAILELQNSEQTISIGSSNKNAIFGVYGDQLVPESPEVSLASPKQSRYPHGSYVIGNVEIECSWPDKDFWPSNKSQAIDYLFTNLKSMLKIENQKTLVQLEQIIYSYIDHANGQFELRKAMDELLSDLVFKCPSLYFAEKLALEHNLVHIYMFSYRSKTFIKADGTSERPFGTLHGDDLIYLFGQAFRDPYNYNHHDRLLSKKLMKVLADFVKNGRLPWPPVLTYGKRVEPLYWKITGSIDEIQVDVTNMTKRCEKMNKLRNHKFYNNHYNDVESLI